MNQLHGLIALILNVRARAEHHRIWVECGSLHGESAALLPAFPLIEQIDCSDIRSFPTLQPRLQPLLTSGRCVFHLGTSQERATVIPVAAEVARGLPCGSGRVPLKTGATLPSGAILLNTRR